MPPRPPRLKFLDDGSLELPLASRTDENGARKAQDAVVLPEPSMVELARVHDLILAADKALEERTEPMPEISPELQAKVTAARRPGAPPADYTDDERTTISKHAEVLHARTAVTFSEESPHAHALRAIVELLTGKALEPADVPGWAMHWSVTSEILARFMDPFAGRAAAMVEEATAALERASEGNAK